MPVKRDPMQPTGTAPVYTGIFSVPSMDPRESRPTATYTDILRLGDRLGKKVGMIELEDIVETIDIGKQNGFKLAEMIIDKWWQENQ